MKTKKQDKAREVFFYYTRGRSTSLLRGVLTGKPDNSPHATVETREGPARVVRLHEIRIELLHPTKLAALKHAQVEAVTAYNGALRDQARAVTYHAKKVRDADRAHTHAMRALAREQKRHV